MSIGAAECLKPRPQTELRSTMHASVIASRGTIAETFEELKSGQRVFRQGSLVRAIAEVVDGTIALSFRIAADREQIIEIVRGGTLLGAGCRGRYSTSARCLSVATLRWMSLDVFASSQKLQRRAIEQQQRQLLSLKSQLVLLGRASAVERVATLLLMLTDDEPAGCASISVRIAQQDMADYLGMTHETVCRTISKLRGMGLIQSDRRGHFTIIAPERLRDVALRLASTEI